MIVLDTHAVVWLRTDPARLPARARGVISRTDVLAIADITLWEIAMLARRGRIDVTGSLERYLTDLAGSYRVLPLTAAVAAAIGSLGDDFPTRDPADQIIFSTASVLGLPLVSADERLRSYDESVIWS